MNLTKSLLALFIISCTVFISHAQKLDKESFQPLKFRHIGPVGNRLISAVGIPGDELTYYVGAASGGIWKTTDGGLNWTPIFDEQPVHAIGALALAPSNTEIVYAGTGESFIRSNVSIGNGVWKSVDGGDSWKQMGLEKTGRIGRIVVHPSNPDIVYVAALGHAYAPQAERGIFKSMDGGKTWQHVLKVDQNTGASEIVMDPSNPLILFAGMWQLSLKTWNRTSGGPGSAIYMSKDGGETWNKLGGNGLPEGPVGKISMAMTPADPNRVYALIETGDGVESINGKKENGELWRSENKGKSWSLINSNRDLGGRQAYYTRVEASPDNANEAYFIAANFYTSIDGGKSTDDVSMTQPNWDHHHMWIDPTDGNRMIVVGDGGLSISKNRGKTWYRVQLPVAQLYHVTTDNAIPYNVLTNRQDGPSMRGPSRTNEFGLFGPGMIPTGAWRDVGGGESGFATADPTDPNIVWSTASGYGALGGVVTRYDVRTGQYRQTEIWPELTAGHTGEMVKYRFQWTFPLLISPHNNKNVYVASQFIHRTMDDGQSWEVISPDLTLNDKSKQQKSGGLTPDNIGVEYANVIYAFEESPLKEGLFWVGTNDGLVQISQDGSQTWTNVTSNIKNLPPLGTVRNIEASRWKEGKAYITVDLHEVGNFDPHVYKTEDYGKSWKKITNGIEVGNLSYARNIKEDPKREGMLYLGTENKLYVSFDDGENWQPFMNGLPATPMYWIDVQEHFNDLVIGTYGRGIWILDDLSALQQLPSDIAQREAVLFKQKDTYRFQPLTANMQFFPEPSWGENPPFGTSIDYWLKEKNDSIKIHIINTTGDTIRTIEQSGTAGLNRVWWDFSVDPVTPLALRTKAEGAEWMQLDSKRTRFSPYSFGNSAYWTAPGKYTVNLVVGEESFTEGLTIIKDPSSEGSLADIQAQDALMRKIHNDLDISHKMVNELEILRRQLYDMQAILKVQRKDEKELLAEVSKLDSMLTGLEGKLVQLKTSGTGQDIVRWPAMLVQKLSYLAATTQISDFKPADQYVEVYNKLHEELEEFSSQLRSIKSVTLPAFYQLLREKEIGYLITEED
ncbi:VPS10 domain-containing protein [Ekhidna sp.]|uniref:VPS10 domain-containing protein n=1 Tax=Ekhidna sp. TaxID=2608089 RepID=UPI003B504F89